MMLSVIDTELWLSAVVETEVTVGAVESKMLLELSEVLVELSEVLVELSEESSDDEVVLSVLAVLLSSDFAHEETITAMLTIRTNQDNIFFILLFYRKCRKSRIKKSQIKTFQSI